LKQLLERKYKKSLKDRAKAEKDIANDVAEIDEESVELKKKVKEIHDLADIEDDELREFVKAKTQEFVEGLSKQ
jgi:phage host-nuclease inhibitor protein Gam